MASMQSSFVFEWLLALGTCTKYSQTSTDSTCSGYLLIKTKRCKQNNKRERERESCIQKRWYCNFQRLKAIYPYFIILTSTQTLTNRIRMITNQTKWFSVNILAWVWYKDSATDTPTSFSPIILNLFHAVCTWAFWLGIKTGVDIQRKFITDISKEKRNCLATQLFK